MRIWEKFLNQNYPNKAKIWAIIGAIFDATIIMVLVLTLFIHSCEICYTTNSIQWVYTSCEKTTSIFENGSPWIWLYKPIVKPVVANDTYPQNLNKVVMP